MSKEVTHRVKSKRMLGGEGGSAGKQRHKLYAVAHARISSAMVDGYYLEAVTLCESMLADRIESRIQFLKYDDPTKHFVDVMGSRLKYWIEIEEVEIDYVKDFGARIWQWVDRRNKVLHEFVKVTEDSDGISGVARIKKAKEVATEGKAIVREISGFVRRHNKWKNVRPT